DVCMYTLNWQQSRGQMPVPVPELQMVQPEHALFVRVVVCRCGGWVGGCGVCVWWCGGGWGVLLCVVGCVRVCVCGGVCVCVCVCDEEMFFCMCSQMCVRVQVACSPLHSKAPLCGGEIGR